MNEIIKSKKDLKDWLKYELGKYDNNGGGVRFRFIAISEKDIIKRHQILLRKAEYHKNCNHKLRAVLSKIRLLKLQNKYSLHIPLNTCGKGLKIMHLGPILINGKARVGEDCVFHINTALVAGGLDGGVPHLGNHVIMGVGSVALGDIHIADNVAVGANALVNRSVEEENIAVAGVPAKKISNNGALEWSRK